MPRHPSLLQLGCVLLLLPVAGPAFAAPSQVATPVREWKTEDSYDAKTGAFNHCLIKNVYDSNVLVVLAENNEGEWRLALHFPQNKMTAGQSYDLTLQVDKGDTFPVEASATTPTMLSIAIPSSLVDQMRKGQQLFLRGPRDEVIYKLNGINGGIDALRDCVASAKNRAPSTTQVASTQAPATSKPSFLSRLLPGLSKPAPTPAPAAPVPVLVPPAAPAVKPRVAATITEEKAPVIANDKVIAQPIDADKALILLPPYWSRIFANVGLSPSLLGDSVLPKPLKFAWVANDLHIGIQEETGGKADRARFINYLRSMKIACGNSFVAETSAVQENKTHQWQLAETACSTARNGDRIAALLFASGPERNSMVIVEGPAARGAEAIKLRNKILQLMN